MAYQQAGNGGPGGAPADRHAPQGTAYTLPGVMSFLQTQWHRFDRERNAWGIDQAEMKTRLAKQEGELNQAKRINEQLERRIKMLEAALKQERTKSKAAAAAAAADVKTMGKEGQIVEQSNGLEKEAEGTAEEGKELKIKKRGSIEGKDGLDGAGADAAKGTTDPIAPLDTNSTATEDLEALEKEREQYLDSTTRHLKNCMKEIQYLLTPPQHPPPPQMLPNGNYSGLPDPPLSIEDIYARHQQQRNTRQPNQGLPQNAAVLNHQSSPAPSSLPAPTAPQQEINRGVQYNEYPEVSQPPSEPGQQVIPVDPSYEESAESVTHTFDSRGRALPDQEPLSKAAPASGDADGWTFDDNPTQAGLPSSDILPPRRPDTDHFPNASDNVGLTAKSPPRGPGSHRRKSSGSQAMSRRRSSQGKQDAHDAAGSAASTDPTAFKVKFALRGHLDVVRSVIFSGGGSPSEPEICSAGDDGTIKRWIVPASYQNFIATNGPDLDVSAFFTHRGHEGVVTSLATYPALTGFSTGGRANGDGWIFSGGQDATVRVWERGRVDPKATLEGHTDAVWSVCVLPATVGTVFGPQSTTLGGPDRLLIVSGSADGTVKVWAVSAPPPTPSQNTGSRRGVGGSRRHSVTSGSNFPTSPQPSVATNTPFSYTLVHTIERAAIGSTAQKPSPTSICPLSPTGETFVVSYTDSSALIFDTRTGEEIIGMASNETYDGTMNTSINAIVATSLGLEGSGVNALDPARGMVESDEVGAGATGSREGIEGVVITGHEDRYVRFFDANSGQCTYTMLAHPAAISSLCLSRDGREAVSAGHDASIRFWSLEKRICTQDIGAHRVMRGEGVCCVSWSHDGRLVVSAGGDGVVKVFARS